MLWLMWVYKNLFMSLPSIVWYIPRITTAGSYDDSIINFIVFYREVVHFTFPKMCKRIWLFYTLTNTCFFLVFCMFCFLIIAILMDKYTTSAIALVICNVVFFNVFIGYLYNFFGQISILIVFLLLICQNSLYILILTLHHMHDLQLFLPLWLNFQFGYSYFCSKKCLFLM